MEATASPDRDLFLDLVEAEDSAPLLHRLREEDPVHFVEPLGFWFVTRHDDVKRLFNEPENASQRRTEWEHFTPAKEGTMLRWLADRQAIGDGTEAHLRFRGLFNSALTPRAVRRMDAQIREVVERIKPLSIASLVSAYEQAMDETRRERIRARAERGSR